MATTKSWALRPLGAADRAAYHQFLAQGAVDHPTRLRFSPADLTTLPYHTAQGADAVTLLAADGETWLGVGTVERELGRQKRRHLAWILRMYVAQPGGGIGRALLRALKSYAAQMEGVEKLNLTVVADNHSAIRLYESEGFSIFSREADALRVDGRGLEELSMSCPLRA